MYLSPNQYSFLCLMLLVLLVGVGGLMIYFLWNRPKK
ncbi:hypothetical protein Slin_6111 [Spirosoma linguale DSM 74]|uniref:Uncharacterized protein n=1 Tax=Spirosoma linguale (strain ATCC 33905 / DSM 74 / LMG 10896 / Claus 1) TaxID=504472 RepID=D2QTE1_SPILD|nr:hypothetical protein Slin_6111 [Spirosoma linguale DSM 74]